MSLTKEDLQAIQVLLEPIMEQQQAMQGTLRTMQEEQQVMKEEQRAMKEEQQAMKEEQRAMKEEQQVMKKEQRTMQETLQAHTGSIMSLENRVMHQLGLISESLPNAVVRNERLHELEVTAEKHDERITKLEHRVAIG